MNEVQDVEVKNVEQESQVVEPQVNILIPERLENESFEDYKQRRAAANFVKKIFKKGAPKMFWDSKTQGVYVKPKEEVTE